MATILCMLDRIGDSGKYSSLQCGLFLTHLRKNFYK
jgi:hypothetical protein